jgi:hypothetical protein
MPPASKPLDPMDLTIVSANRDLSILLAIPDDGEASLWDDAEPGISRNSGSSARAISVPAAVPTWVSVVPRSRRRLMAER